MRAGGGRCMALGPPQLGRGINMNLAPQPMSSPLRWLCLACGLGLLALLGTARYLTPAQSGLGTHEQLGLPPCTAILLWGKPCPTCGMTTSWAWAMRGNLVEAARANVGGLMLVAIAIGYLPASCYFFLVGRCSSGYWFSRTLATCLVISLTVTMVQWLARLAG